METKQGAIALTPVNLDQCSFMLMFYVSPMAAQGFVGRRSRSWEEETSLSVMLLQKAALVDWWTRSQPLHINGMYLHVMHRVCEKGYLTSKTKWVPQVCKSTCAWLVGTFICHPVLHGSHIVRVSMIFWAAPLPRAGLGPKRFLDVGGISCSQSVGPGHHVAGSV